MTNSIGLSQTASVELSRSLEFKIGIDEGPELSEQLNEKYGFSVTRSHERVESTQLTLEGPATPDTYRYFAIWRRAERLCLDLLVLRNAGLSWQSEIVEDYVSDESAAQISIDLPVRRERQLPGV
jgi:hypothetical protein